MKQCAEWKTVTGADGKPKTRCASYSDNDSVLVPKTDGEDVGYLQVTKAVGALGDVQAVNTIPPLVGGASALLTTLLIRKFNEGRQVDPNTGLGGRSEALNKNAPLIGAIGGVACSIPLYWWKRKAAVISGAVTGAVTGVGLYAYERALESAWYASLPSATSGVGLLSAQQRRRPALGAMLPRVKPTAAAPRGVRAAMDVTAFGART